MKRQGFLSFFFATILMEQIFIASAVEERKIPLQDQLAQLEEQYGGRLGLMAKNLKSGESVVYQAEEKFPTASVIKLPVMAAYFELVRQGKIDPGKLVELREQDKKPGSGILPQLTLGTRLPLADLVRLMITLSDNTATNLVLDQMGKDALEQTRAVNGYLAGIGLVNTRLLNRVFSPETKPLTPEAIRYGLGVSTPQDMVLLLEKLYAGHLVSPVSSRAMIEILKQQFYSEMIPRFLPLEECEGLQFGHKTGFVQESQADAGIIFSRRADIALAIFVDKQADHREVIDSRGQLLGAHAAKAVWDYFALRTSSPCPATPAYDVDWSRLPGGKWGIYRSAAAPFPHPAREQGFRRQDGPFYPRFPHYADSSIVVFVPDRFKEGEKCPNLMVHFHGHGNDNLGVLERYGMVQTMLQEKVNAILVIPQGPYRARDSFGGKMEDEGGGLRLIDDVLAMLAQEKIVTRREAGRIILSAHSGGYRPLAFALERGGMASKVALLFLFDALYAEHDFFRHWITSQPGIIRAAYTEHLAGEHRDFLNSLAEEPRKRFLCGPTTVPHDEVVQAFFSTWLRELPEEWKTTRP